MLSGLLSLSVAAESTGGVRDRSSSTSVFQFGKGWPKGNLAGPFVIAASPKMRAAAERINDYLSFSADASSTTLVEVFRNDARLLSFRVELDACAAYCETYVTQFNFDALSGRALSADDLLTPSGRVLIDQSMFDERTRRYRKEIAQLTSRFDQLRTQQLPAAQDTLADIKNRI